MIVDDVLIRVVALIPCFGFLAVYPLRARARASTPGRALMALMTVLTVVVGQSLWSVLFGIPPQIVRNSIFAAGALVVWVMFLTLLVERNRDRRPDEYAGHDDLDTADTGS